MQHFSTAHIDAHMGNARRIVSADEKIKSPGLALAEDTGVEIL